MKVNEFWGKLECLISQVKTGVLASVDRRNRPVVRWLIVKILKGHPGVLLALTRSDSDKVRQLRFNQNAEWMFQNPQLTEIIKVRGKVNIIDNVSLRSELLENMAQSLQVLWKISSPENDFVVLEMEAETGVCFSPLAGKQEIVKLA